MSRTANTLLLAGILALSGAALAPAVNAIVIPLDPRATYLHTCNDGAVNAPAINLASLGLSPGQTIVIEVLGEWDCGSPCGDTETATGAVFSSTASLLPGSSLNRVTGAIAAGTPAVTGPPFWCSGDATDIPEDFRVDASYNVVIPAGAAFIFIGALDSLFDDNSDPDADYAVKITEAVVPVEPSTWSRLKTLYR